MSTRRLKVILRGGHTYDIRIGHRLITNLGIHLRATSKATKASKALVISDDHVGPLYLAAVKAGLEKADFEVFDVSIPPGEDSKSLAVAAELFGALALFGIGGDDVLVALGGGVVCDIAGFVAANYLCGIEYVQVPTSFLAMVDSPVGGKTAVNLEGRRNLVGSLKQPTYVAVDLAVLSSLPDEEWENGLAEIARFALIDGEEFTEWLTTNAEGLMAHDEAAVQQALVEALSFKARCVTHLEKSEGRIECLDYGNVFAHALEAVAGQGIVSHGRIVAEGMRFAARLAVEAIGAPEGFVVVQDALLNSLGLAPILQAYSADALFDALLSEKARGCEGSELRIIFTEAPGKWQSVGVDPDLVKIYLILWEQARMEP
ncbi:MAG: 3-dehydroquinate synthase [Coriobacteriales bacterium]|jgi:3-dehydroquinate synthase|nr:3-dehydroquinate synthase [Coriobacteriales bacterium]